MRILALLAGLFAFAQPAIAAPATRVAVAGTSFQINAPDGVLLTQDQLPGVILTLGDGKGAQRRIRIDTAEHDPMDPSGETMLYALSEQDPETRVWINACQSAPDGTRVGFPLPGAFSADGVYHPEHPGILITCTGGAEGKCIRFGYKPWARTPDGTSLAPFYQACVRLVRADYCGDGTGHTRNGTPIDLFDRIGIQADEIAPGMSFEAAFNPEGAICVAHPRLPDELSLTRLREICPRLALVSGPACNETAPGLLFVRSYERGPGDAGK